MRLMWVYLHVPIGWWHVWIVMIYHCLIGFETQLKAFEKDLEVSVVGGWISEFENNPKQIISYRKSS